MWEIIIIINEIMDDENKDMVYLQFNKIKRVLLYDAKNDRLCFSLGSSSKKEIIIINR